jgi:hypothetical protein
MLSKVYGRVHESTRRSLAAKVGGKDKLLACLRRIEARGEKFTVDDHRFLSTLWSECWEDLKTSWRDRA